MAPSPYNAMKMVNVCVRPILEVTNVTDVITMDIQYFRIALHLALFATQVPLILSLKLSCKISDF